MKKTNVKKKVTKKVTKKKVTTETTTKPIENVEAATRRMVSRIVSGSYQDMQMIRIATKNRIRDIIRKKIEGIPFNAVEEKKDDGKNESVDKYKKFSDLKMLELLEQLNKDGKIEEEEYKYIMDCWNLALESMTIENKYKLAMLKFVKQEPIYTTFLINIKGIGEVLSANLIKEFGYCERFDTVSKLNQITGNGVDNGLAPKKRKGEEIHYNPRLRTLTWKLSDCLLKSNKGMYRKIYDRHKIQLNNREYALGDLFKKYGKPYTEKDIKLSKGHIHNMALRAMRKMFISHFWSCSRELMGLDNRLLYVQEKLGHKNITTWQDAIFAESTKETIKPIKKEPTKKEPTKKKVTVKKKVTKKKK